ncbi:5-hydroxytryptamine receptor 1A [Alligator mississippiensis]|uniref:5-hydroxytryptamine receptor 1A n=1 Tax=Alligator mississippiensis TaxID=8496 RepID=A0A151MXE8_ALLMI|nr:5-hydroxytryptamine receptor 1A [Alligator mississippiensis]KYO29172.1 5-hydroxytryptamine receptor 1A [Alligator mississippiensis]
MEGTNSTRARAGGNGTAPAELALSYQVLTSLLLGALVLCAVIGNACVIAAIALERSLQTVANYLIGSLAVADLMVSVLVLPMAALYQVLKKWTLGQVTCDIFISLDVLCCTSSILHLCAIALDRYWAITDPIDYVNKRTPRRAAALISLTWLIGFLISIPPMLGWRTPEDRSNPDACTISKDHGYTIYSTFGAFYIPLLLMLVLYGRIFRAARFRIRKSVRKADKKRQRPPPGAGLPLSPAGHEKRKNGEPGRSWRRAVEPKPGACVNGAVRHGEDGAALEIIEVHHYNSSSGAPLPLPLPLPGDAGGAPGERKNEKSAEAKRKMALARERKTVKTLGIIMGTFILCWLPFFIVALVLPFCDAGCYMPDWLGAVINWLGYSNSLLNPIIYAYFNKDFQSAFKKIVKCKFCRQ